MPHLTRPTARTPHHLGFWCLLLGSLLLLPALSRAQSPEPLTPFRASYTAKLDKGLALNGDARRSLTPQGNGVWLYRTEVNSFIANINESLVLRWDDGRVVPLRYRYRLSGMLVKDREQAIDFDWDAGVATGQYRGKSFELPLREGALDPLGYQLQLRQDIRAGRRDMRYQVIDGGDYDENVFAVVGEDGDRHLLKAEKVRSPDAKRRTYLWFDPDQAFLLVRLLQVEPDGSRYELTLSEAELGD